MILILINSKEIADEDEQVVVTIFCLVTQIFH